MIRLGSRTSAGTGAGSTPRGRARASGDHGDGAGRACLTASALLVRRAWRCPDRDDEQLLLRMAQLLDALHRGAQAPANPTGSGSAAPMAASAVPGAITRLAEQLDRLERASRHPVDPGRARSGPGRGR